MTNSTHNAATDVMESPLHHHVAHTNAVDAGVVMTEDKFRGHLNLRGNPQDADFMAAVASVLGMALPTEPNTSVRVNGFVAYCTTAMSLTFQQARWYKPLSLKRALLCVSWKMVLWIL